MKKTNKQTPPPTTHSQGFLDLAGEAMSVLGHEIVEGKDKMIDAAAEKFTAVKKAIGKIVKKKVAPVPKKQTTVKRSAKKTVKKAIARVVKKAPAKAVKKSIKKVARKVAKKKAVVKRRK